MNEMTHTVEHVEMTEFYCPYACQCCSYSCGKRFDRRFEYWL